MYRPARKYNLEKCRKELERSCANYQSRGNHFPPTPRTTPGSSSAPSLQPQHSPEQKKVRFQTSQSLNETAHVSQKVKRNPFEYNEDELRQRAQRIRADLKQELKPRSHPPPVSTSDPLDGISGHSLSNDDSNNDHNPESHAPRRHRTLHRQDLTQDDVATIRATAERIASHCTVRDKQPYPDSPRQGNLHGTKSTIGLEKAGAEGLKSAKNTQDDDGISVTEDGCIIQHGFDISPIASSPADNVHVRCDSGFDLRHATPNEMSRKEPFRPNVRNKRGARVPVCFRKQEVPHQRNVSHLSALLSGQSPSPDRPEAQGTAQEKLRRAHAPQQCSRMPIPARPSVFFSGSSSSNAVVSESEDDDEEQTVCGSEKVDSDTSSAVCADGSKDVASPGSIATLVNSNKLAETVKTSDHLPQHFAPPSPLSSSKRPAPPPQVKQNRPPHAGTPLPQRPSKHPDSNSHPQVQDPGRLPPHQRRNPQPQSLRSQQTAKILLAHQQHRRAPKPPSPRARSPCQALGLRLPLPPNYGEHNYVSALNDKIDRNGGRRPANFSWDHVAPMHGFSSCPALNVLD
ncbi:unnamed protein product [Aureobasidium mustum]|uniref:Uncharacterized protein n=1 Tax=Aureobasidium mustum TaxID=2773714 RepID=A0A9N8K698_9PEZI|nr:unnamed protein product [Aureobasidium mustum]